MKKLLIISGTISAAIALGWTSEAKADLVFCNRIDRPIYMALSQKTTDDRSKISVKGWWYAKPGQCQIVYLNRLKPGESYGYYAVSDDGKKKWGGNANGVEICVNDNGFDALSTATSDKNSQCTTPNYSVRFKWLDTENQPGISFDFS
jgi:uncharacterized membrane protein